MTICSDSQAALEAIRSSKPGRPDVVLEIRLLLEQMRLRGSPVTLQWVPSHVGLYGNEAADAAAKAAARRHPVATQVTIPHSAAEVKNLIKNTVRKRWAARKTRLAQKYNIPTFHKRKTTQHKTASRYFVGLANRLKTDSWRLKFRQVTCLCGEEFTPEHAIFECDYPTAELETARGDLQTLGVNSLVALFSGIFEHQIEKVLKALSESPLGAVV